MSSDDRQYVIDELFLEIANALYPTKEDAAQKPVYPTFDFEDDEDQYEHIVDATLDHYYDSIEHYNKMTVAWFKSEFPDFVINLNTQVVGSCNYKGECESDVMLFDTNKHKPIFVSTSHSFYQANQE
jgi:DNA repair photolyase